jgi:SseB protein N-terminal domain
MDITGAAWAPANETERILYDAWRSRDTVGFLRTLAEAPLYLPGFAAREGSQRLLTWRHDAQTFLLAFTSPEALYQGLTDVVDGWRLTSMSELIAARPEVDWGIVVSPNAPIGAYLLPDELAEIGKLLTDDPTFHPASVAEAVMYRGQQDANPGAYLDALVVSPVLMPVRAPLAATSTPSDLDRDDFPWRVETLDGVPTVAVFTSEQRMAEAITEPVPVMSVDAMALARAWPDPAWQLAVNPGSAISATFAGAQLADLIAWGLRLLAQERATSAPAPEWVEMEVAVADVDRYLLGGYDRVDGEVRPSRSVPLPHGTHVVRWPRGDSLVDASQVPSGAQIYRIDPSGDRLIATYQSDLRRWLPAVADLLRGRAPS